MALKANVGGLDASKMRMVPLKIKPKTDLKPENQKQKKKDLTPEEKKARKSKRA